MGMTTYLNIDIDIDIDIDVEIQVRLGIISDYYYYFGTTGSCYVM